MGNEDRCKTDKAGVRKKRLVHIFPYFGIALTLNQFYPQSGIHFPRILKISFEGQQ